MLVASRYLSTGTKALGTTRSDEQGNLGPGTLSIVSDQKSVTVSPSARTSRVSNRLGGARKKKSPSGRQGAAKETRPAPTDPDKPEDVVKVASAFSRAGLQAATLECVTSYVSGEMMTINEFELKGMALLSRDARKDRQLAFHPRVSRPKPSS